MSSESMRKLKYVWGRIIHMDYRNMIKIAKKVSKKAHKSFLWIFCDMIYCGFRYQAGYYDYQEFEFYHLKKEERKTFLTRGINNSIIKKYNDRAYWYLFDDKIIFNKRFSNYVKRDWISLKEATVDEFEQFLIGKEEIIAKPVDGNGGTGVEKISVDSTDMRTLYERLKNNKQYLVEEVIKQHKNLQELYPGSVNTLRMFTFSINGKAYLLQSLLKIGNGGVIDNFSGGGMYTFTNEKGQVLVPAIDKDDHYYGKHPITKKQIIGFQVPHFEEAKVLVEKAALEIPEVAYIGWDVAITDHEAILIEGNCFPGVFQMKPSLNKEKVGILPTYQKYMDIER